jgi:hypothetical protein
MVEPFGDLAAITDDSRSGVFQPGLVEVGHDDHAPALEDAGVQADDDPVLRPLHFLELCEDRNFREDSRG